jgi:hypothetical protein
MKGVINNPNQTQQLLFSEYYAKMAVNEHHESSLAFHVLNDNEVQDDEVLLCFIYAEINDIDYKRFNDMNDGYYCESLSFYEITQVAVCLLKSYRKKRPLWDLVK